LIIFKGKAPKYATDDDDVKTLQKTLKRKKRGKNKKVKNVEKKRDSC